MKKVEKIRIPIKPLKMNQGFLNGMGGIFNKKNVNEKDDCVEATNLNDSTQNLSQQNIIKKEKNNSKKKIRSAPLTNPDIKYKNNKKKMQRKIVRRKISGNSSD